MRFRAVDVELHQFQRRLGNHDDVLGIASILDFVELHFLGAVIHPTSLSVRNSKTPAAEQRFAKATFRQCLEAANGFRRIGPRRSGPRSTSPSKGLWSAASAGRFSRRRERRRDYPRHFDCRLVQATVCAGVPPWPPLDWPAAEFGTVRLFLLLSRVVLHELLLPLLLLPLLFLLPPVFALLPLVFHLRRRLRIRDADCGCQYCRRERHAS